MGYYLPLDTDDETKARRMMNTSQLKQMWCSIYDEAGVADCIRRFDGEILPMKCFNNLDYDWHEVNKE